MKEKFIKSTIILVIGGLVTKVLAMVIRVIITRFIGEDNIGLYMLIMPTYNLFITISSFSLATSLSKLVSENKRNNKNVVLGIIPFAIIYNIIIMLVLVLSSSFIANNLLKNCMLYYPILSIGFTLPFITLSSIIRGYFFGKERMFPHIISNIIEQVVRIVLIIVITPYILKRGIIVTISYLVLLNIVSEICSIIVLMLFLPRDFKITRDDIKPRYDNIKDTFSISFPTTCGRLIGSFGNFLEPVIVTFVLLSMGYSNSYITSGYGVINGYVLPMVTMPMFLTSAISSALLPVISKYSSDGNIKRVKKKIKQAIGLSLLVGVPSSLLLILFPGFFLNIVFKVSSGENILRFASIIFLPSYIISPLVSSLQAMNKAKYIARASFIGIIIKTITLFITLYFDIGMIPILLSYFTYYIFNVFYLYGKIKKINC